MDNPKEKRGYWKLKEEAMDHTLWKTIWKRLSTCYITGYRMNEMNELEQHMTNKANSDCINFLVVS
jgi:hypothetical protein